MKATAACVALGIAALLVAGVGAEPVPVPALEWSPWKPVADCGGAQYFASISRYDGRNDMRVRLKVQNGASHLISTRFDVRVTSDDGEVTLRSGGSRIIQGREAEGGSFDLGQVFETRVNSVLTSRIARIEFTRLETANVEKLPSYATPSTYLGDFVDFPKAACAAVSIDVGQGDVPRFMRLTTSCYRRLPQWTATCQDAVDAIMREADTAPESRIPCLKDWRAFQKCYESYAYGPNPSPRPDCIQQLPRCNYP